MYVYMQMMFVLHTGVAVCAVVIVLDCTHLCVSVWADVNFVLDCTHLCVYMYTGVNICVVNFVLGCIRLCVYRCHCLC